VGLIATVMLTLALIGCAGTSNSTSTGEYIDDRAISAKVKTALHTDDDVSGFQVNVETFKGTVQLSGFVDTAAQAERAEEIARGVDGVEDVVNNISVK
jgi:osmotically-inducible protein OsmY